MPKGDAKKALARPAVDRVLDRVLVDWATGCWIWPGATASNDQYGTVTVGSRSDGSRRTVATHIVVWEAFFGPVPDGLELDHLCRVTLCCNPDHLEAVTHKVNCERQVLSEAELRRRSEWMSYFNSNVRWAG